MIFSECGCIAQLVEHCTFNTVVIGSSPIVSMGILREHNSTRQLKVVIHYLVELVAQLVVHQTDNLGVVGSSPTQLK